MRTTTTHTKNAWLSGDFVGANRPMMRATIQRLHTIVVPYKRQLYSSMIFGQTAHPVELPNIKSIKWERSLDADAATMTMELYNTVALPLGAVPERDDELGRPGHYTFSHGTKVWSTTRWGYTPNEWRDRIIPDAIIRTYEGYGYDPSVHPEYDEDMYSSGVWRVDEVDYDTKGLITVTCRDIGSALIDQVMFPPVAPFAFYPLYYSKQYPVPNPDIVTVTGSTAWKRPTYDDDSNTPYVGHDGDVHSHHGDDAFDTSNGSYWLSIGNARPDADYSFEWVQGKFSSGTTVSGVKVTTWGGPYRMYVSFYTDGDWHGSRDIPYNPDDPASAPNGSDISYSIATTAGHETTTTVTLGLPLTGVTKVRVTFTDLYNSGIGPYYYRAGVRDFQVLVGSQVTHVTDGGTHLEPTLMPDGPGVTDYIDIVKQLCAYGGFYWPRGNGQDYIRRSDNTVQWAHPLTDDPRIGRGRVWGDFMTTGTVPEAKLGIDVWDKKPLMDGIRYVCDITGFIFFIDDTGGAVCRLPNVFGLGNYTGDAGTARGRTRQMVTIDERTTLTSLTVKLSSRNIRERVFVANSNGRFGAVVIGHNPYPSGLRRTGGWTDQNFESQDECVKMADLITLQQLFTYRADSVVIPGNPAIQIDDQVQIWERITQEGYIHYIKGITSEWDIESGKWTYSLETQWLGEQPFGSWVFDPKNLDPKTQEYLNAMGVLDV